MLGMLRTIRKKHGLPSVVRIDIPSCGFAASVLARELGLSLDLIEAVLVNHQGCRLDHCIMPGDNVVFVPKEVSGHHAMPYGAASSV